MAKGTRVKHITAWNVWGHYFACFTCGSTWKYEGKGIPQSIGKVDPGFKCPNQE